MLDVRRLRLLRELAHRHTIAAVAEALNFTASAVSQQLSALERDAGVALLERRGRRVILTPAGHRLVEHADAVLERLDLAGAELAHARHGIGGPLRIGTFPSAARTLLPSALAALVGEHPGLEPRVVGIDSAKVSDGLRSGELDVALVHDHDLVPAPPDSTMDTVELLNEPMFLADVRVEETEPPPEADLTELLRPWRTAPWITAAPGTTGHSATVRTCQAAGFTPKIRHHVNDFAAVLAFVAAGQGVALVPQLATVEPVEGVTLTRLPLHRRSKVAFRRGRGDHPAIAAFVTALHEVVRYLR